MVLSRLLALILLVCTLAAGCGREQPGPTIANQTTATAIPQPKVLDADPQEMGTADFVGIITACLNVGVTMALAWLTWRYVYLTKQILQVTSAAREPFVDIELDSPEHFIRLVVVNAGGTTARNITFRVIRDCDAITHGSASTGISDLHPIKHGISYLPAGQRLLFEAGLYNPPPPVGTEMLIVELSYADDAGRAFSRTVRYDLRQLNSVLFETYKNNFVGVSNAIREAQRKLVDSQRPSPLSHMGTQSCPVCCQRISSSAKKCPHCHEWIGPKAIAEPSAEASSSTT